MRLVEPIGVALAVALVAVAGCQPVHDPWDSTGHFEAERARAPANAQELRQRTRLQSDRTYG